MFIDDRDKAMKAHITSLGITKSRSEAMRLFSWKLPFLGS